MNTTQLKYKRTMTKIGAILLIFVGLLSAMFSIYYALPVYFLPDAAITVVDSILYDIAYLASFMVPVAFVPLFFRSDERQPMRLGIKLPSSTFALVCIGIAFTYAFSYINSMTVTAIFGEVAYEELPQTYMSNTDVILEFITVALVPAFCEEFLFRGVVLSHLMPYGKSTAVVISSICFGLMHGNLYQFLYTTVAGLILGVVYVATDSIWPSTLIHMFNNALSVMQMVMYERFPEDEAYVIWLVIEATIMLIGVVAFVFLIKRSKRENKDRASIFGKPLSVGAADGALEFCGSAKLDAKDAVRLFFVPTMLVFVIYQVASALLMFISV